MGVTARATAPAMGHGSRKDTGSHRLFVCCTHSAPEASARLSITSITMPGSAATFERSSIDGVFRKAAPPPSSTRYLCVPATAGASGLAAASPGAARSTSMAFSQLASLTAAISALASFFAPTSSISDSTPVTVSSILAMCSSKPSSRELSTPMAFCRYARVSSRMPSTASAQPAAPAPPSPPSSSRLRLRSSCARTASIWSAELPPELPLGERGEPGVPRAPKWFAWTLTIGDCESSFGVSAASAAMAASSAAAARSSFWLSRSEERNQSAALAKSRCVSAMRISSAP